MIKIENVELFGFEAAIRGMRNPMNSWDKSDSVKCYANANCLYICSNNPSRHCIGQNDISLMQKLYKAGSDHRKFMRFITVSIDVVAPLYWWKEFDTYKVGTVANSCSTMHKIHENEFTANDFSYEHTVSDLHRTYELKHGTVINESSPLYLLTKIISELNYCRKEFLSTNDKHWWYSMIQLLPSSYNQRRTILLNYEVLANMYHVRKNHKLDEWVEFCKWIEELPYFMDIVEGV